MRYLQGVAVKVAVLSLGLACVPLAAAKRVPQPATDGGHGQEQAQVLEPTAPPAEHRGGRLLRREHPLVIQHGVLTVDGLTVRSGISTRVADLQYLYVCVPGTGVVVIAEHPFSGAREEPAAFQGRTLTVLAGTNRIQLTAANRMRSNASAFVRFEPGETPGTRTPALGFGDAALLPAMWSPHGAGTQAGRHRYRAHHPLRTARLCRPSPKGSEMCAMIREVLYQR